MPDQTASRTLVKSAPELWAECSEAASLARHLGAFGEIRITKLEPETAVAWEGEAVRGTVRLEPSGWGTRVILTAQDAPSPDPEPEDEQPPPTLELAPEARPGRLRRIFMSWRRGPAPAGSPEPDAEAGTHPATAPETEAPASELLDAALDSLGRAHHRPYSRA